MLPDHRPTPVPKILAAINQVVLGKGRQTRLALSCLLAKGHLLIEDRPGVGKTTLAQALARLLGFQFARIQFTSDMLPADILGVSIYDRERNAFRFLPGPVFCQLLLADEINRATPKTQSALLEAMEEEQVTTEGETRSLPSPFFVIATQNPASQVGTFPLPESQLDRFLMRIDLGYPDLQAERTLLESGGRRQGLPALAPVLTPEHFAELQRETALVHASSALLDYLQALIEATRNDPRLVHGLSPRAALSLLSAARAWAFTDARHSVQPEDVQAVFPAVARHRLRLGSGRETDAEDLCALIRSVPIP